MSNIIYLHRQPAPVARFLRVSEHRRVEHLLEADRLPYDRFVIEAGWLAEQQDLIAALRQKGGRRLGSCMDRRCCPQGFDDTIKDPKGHFLRQRAYRCDDLSAVPEAMRARHYLDKILKEDERRAKQLAKLKLSDEKLSARLVENANRLDRFSDVLDNLEQTSGTTATRSVSFMALKPNAQASKDKR